MFDPKEAVHYRVRHETVYRYRSDVTLMPHRLVVRPREWHDARLESFSLTVSPHALVEWSRDVYGNSIAWVMFDHQTQDLRFTVDFVVQLRRSKELVAEDKDPIPGSFPVEYDDNEHAVVSAYQTPVFQEDTATLSEWLQKGQLVKPERSAVENVLALTQEIYQTIRYQRREENGTQTPGTTLTLGTGSCRDKATLLMEALRHLGFAARFASGYLDCAATRAAEGSTHAWTEVYFPDLGWRGFDPTTGKRTTHQHIVTGLSHHPRGVMPVSGKIVGPSGALEKMQVFVTVDEIKA